MNAPTTFFAEAQTILATGAGLARRARQLLDYQRESRLEREFRECADDAAFPIRVAVVGPYSAGKSTFINAITGRFTREQRRSGMWHYAGPLPSDRQIKSAVCVEICHIPNDVQEYAELTFQDGSHESVTLDAAARKIAFESSGLSIAEKVRQFLERADRVDSAIYFLHIAPWLRNVRLIDTPGLNSRAEGHSEMALSAVRVADAVLYLVDEAIDDSDRRALVDIKDFLPQMIFVQTKADLAHDGLTSRMESNARAVATWLEIEAPRFVAVSSRLEMAQCSGEPSDGARSGFEELRVRIEAMIVASAKVRLGSLRRRVANQLSVPGRLLDEMLSSLNDLALEDDARMRQLETTIASAASLGESLDEGYESVRVQIEGALDQRRAAWISRMVAAAGTERRGDGSADRCATAIQRKARSIFESEIGPMVKRALERNQNETMARLRDALEARLRPVDLKLADITLQKPIIRSGPLSRFLRWLANAEISETELSKTAESALDSIIDQVRETANERIRALKSRRAECQSDQERKLEIRLKQAAEKLVNDSCQCVEKRQLVQDLRDEISRAEIELTKGPA